MIRRKEKRSENKQRERFDWSPLLFLVGFLTLIIIVVAANFSVDNETLTHIATIEGLALIILSLIVWILWTRVSRLDSAQP
jgi:hypothetical protein